MLFGEVPLDRAEGAFLAHSLTAPGIAFRKGRILSANDIALLRAAGLDRVVAVRLEPDDVAEDAAASRIALALTGPGLTPSPAQTGRVNLHADAPGLLVLDADRIDRLNLLDEAVTVATLPNHTVVAPGDMVATVKIIPFAAPEPAVVAAEGIGAAGGPPIRLAPWQGLRAGLVQTVLPGLKPSVLDKTAAVTRGRLEACGGMLVEERRVPHSVQAVAAALDEMASSGLQLLLACGASAVTDRRDVLPAGIEAAGGGILHFGMPVDPGNLLLMGRLRGLPVLGLPGCARSPKLNGFDWVLQRLAAGLEVERGDIMRMGVGGLLMEIASRPLPRALATSAHSKIEPSASAAEDGRPRVAAVVLAAGLSRRMGAPKLLADLDGKPLVAHAVDAALASRASPVFVVTGHRDHDLRAALTGRPVTFVHADDHARGLSASLAAGIGALPADVHGAVVLLGDMPRVRPATIDTMIDAFAPTTGAAILAPLHGGRRGNPVLWDRRFFGAMCSLEGDMGARTIMRDNPDALLEVDVDDPGVLIDVDTPDDLAALRDR